MAARVSLTARTFWAKRMFGVRILGMHVIVVVVTIMRVIMRMFVVVMITQMQSALACAPRCAKITSLYRCAWRGRTLPLDMVVVAFLN
jgi:hypothetical protein